MLQKIIASLFALIAANLGGTVSIPTYQTPSAPVSPVNVSTSQSETQKPEQTTVVESQQTTNPPQGCKVDNTATQYVICVDIHRQRASIYSASNGQLGSLVKSEFIITSSRHICNKKREKCDKYPDSITLGGKNGNRILRWPQSKTKKHKLLYFISFNGEQGIHYYSTVGPKYDSHGCIRMKMNDVKEVWSLIGANGNKHTIARQAELSVFNNESY